MLVDLPAEVINHLSRFLDLIGNRSLVCAGSKILCTKIHRGDRHVIALGASLPSGYLSFVAPLQELLKSDCTCPRGFHFPESKICDIDLQYPMHSAVWIAQTLGKPFSALSSLRIHVGHSPIPVFRSMMEERIVMRESMPNLAVLAFNTSYSAFEPHVLSEASVHYIFATLPDHLVTFELKDPYSELRLDLPELACTWPESLQAINLTFTQAELHEIPSWVKELNDIKLEMGDRLCYDPELLKIPDRPWNQILPPSLTSLSLASEMNLFYDYQLTPELAQSLPPNLTYFKYEGDRSYPDLGLSSSDLPVGLTFLDITGALFNLIPDTLPNLRTLTYSEMPRFPLKSLEAFHLYHRRSAIIQGPGMGPLHTLSLDIALRGINSTTSPTTRWLLDPPIWNSLRNLILENAITSDNMKFIMPPNLTRLSLMRLNRIDELFLRVLPTSMCEIHIGEVASVDSQALLSYLRNDESRPNHLHTLEITSKFISDSTNINTEKNPSLWFCDLLKTLPSSLTRLKLEFANQSIDSTGSRVVVPFDISDTVEWPKQLKHLSLVNDHISVSSLLSTSFPDHLESLHLRYISIGSADDLLQLPTVLSRPPFCRIPLTQIPLWIPYTVYESMRKLGLEEETVGSSPQSAEPEDPTSALFASDPVPEEQDTAIVRAFIKETPLLSNILNVLEHFTIVSYSEFDRPPSQRSQRGFTLF